MIIGAGQQFPRNNSHCVFQLQNGSGTTFTDTGAGRAGNRSGDVHSTGTAWTEHVQTTGEPFTSCISYDGTDDYLTFGTSADFNPYNSNYTWEFFWKPVNLQEQMFFAYYYLDINTYFNYLSFKDTNAGIITQNKFNGIDYAFFKENAAETGVTGYNINQCYHIAMVKNGLNWKVFRDGKQIITGDSTEEKNHNGNGTLYIGSSWAPNKFVYGAIANIRFHKGIALWTRNFTPPNRAS